MAYHRRWTDGTGHDSDRFLDIFSEHDFISMDEECNFFCPECRLILKCRVYKETKDAWEFFYM